MKTLTLLYVLTLLFGLLGSAAADAENLETENERDTSHTEIITVNALRLETNIEDHAGTVVIVSAQDMQTRQDASLAQSLSVIPGLNVVQSGPFGAVGSIFSRGMDSDHVVVLLDGIRLNNSASPSGQFNAGTQTSDGIAQIEFIGGPSSLHYGSDALGGIINIVPHGLGHNGNDLIDDAARFLALGLGNEGRQKISFASAQSTEKAKLVVSGSAYKTDGFNATPNRFSLSGDEKDGATAVSGTIVGQYRLQNKTELEMLVHSQNSRNDFDSFSASQSGFQRGDDVDLETSLDRLNLWRAGLSHDWSNLRSTLKFGQVKTWRKEHDGDLLTANDRSSRTFVDWQNNLALSSIMTNRPTTIALGLQWESEEIDIPVSFNSPFSSRRENYGFYGLGQWKNLSGSLLVEGGLRYDHDSFFGDVTTFKIGQKWRIFDQKIQIFANYGTAFNAPTLTEIFGVNAFNIGNPELNPEKSEGSEIGVTLSDWKIGDVAFNSQLTFYLNDVESLISYDFSARQNINIGRASMQGLDAHFLLSSPAIMGRSWPWELTSSYGYVEALNKDTDQQLLRRPKHHASLAMTLNPHEDIRFGLQGQYVGERLDATYDDFGFYEFSSPNAVGHYTLVNATISYDLSDQLRIKTKISNLFDEDYEPANAFAGEGRHMFIELVFTP